jgi:glutathione-regulated potassium-efflux system ancillary protein KefG
MNQNRILLIYAHRDPTASRINRALFDAAAALSNVTAHDLTTQYPDFRIDVEREQQLLLEHDSVVLQFPIHWYSTPAILKEWQDAVLGYGFAYGKGGDKLRGKKLMVAATSNGAAENYQVGGSDEFTLGELLRPLQAMAKFTGMQYQPIFATMGIRALDDAALNEVAKTYCARLVAI